VSLIKYKIYNLNLNLLLFNILWKPKVIKQILLKPIIGTIRLLKMRKIFNELEQLYSNKMEHSIITIVSGFKHRQVHYGC